MKNQIQELKDYLEFLKNEKKYEVLLKNSKTKKYQNFYLTLNQINELFTDIKHIGMEKIWAYNALITKADIFSLYEAQKSAKSEIEITNIKLNNIQLFQQEIQENEK